jgi:hypothetical protein
MMWLPTLEGGSPSMRKIQVLTFTAILTSPVMLFGQFSLGAPGTMTLVRTNYEVGVSYQGEAIAKEVYNCAATGVGRWINWNDGSPEGVQLGTNATPQGPYNLFNRAPGFGGFDVYAGIHVFTNDYVGQRTVTLGIQETCRNFGHNPVEVTYPAQVGVYGRLPIRLVVPQSQPAKRSATVTVTVKLFNNAPPSNTRVNVEAPPSVFSNPPSFVDVPSQAAQASFPLTVRPDAPVGAATITVWNYPDEKHEVKVDVSE